MSDDKELATPPWTTLRKLEAASLAFEKNEDGMEEKWLKQLLAPGSPLGGARPKASISAPDGSLWIAKFPSKHDDINVGAWEMNHSGYDVYIRYDCPFRAESETISFHDKTFNKSDLSEKTVEVPAE